MTEYRYIAKVDGVLEPYVKTFGDAEGASELFREVCRTVFDEGGTYDLAADDGRTVVLDKGNLVESYVTSEVA